MPSAPKPFPFKEAGDPNPSRRVQVTIHEAKTNLSKLIVAANEGQEVVIAKGDNPIARLIPFEETPKPKRQFGSMKGMFEIGSEFFDPLPEEELRAWEGEND